MPRAERPVLQNSHKISWKQLKECGVRFSEDLRTGLSGRTESSKNVTPNFSRT